MPKTKKEPRKTGREWSIGELAREVGLRPSALRYYEELGLLTPERRVSGRRRYGEESRTRLAVIDLAQRSGFTLKEIKVLMADIDRRRLTRAWKTMAKDKLVELEAQERRLHAMRRLLDNALACQCVDLRDCALVAEART
ncbi:MAG: MerR family transcriptional regulator [Myxococcota bacterium]